MADERTYGFNKDDAESLLQGIGNGEGWFPEIKPRGGGGGVQIIRFEIISVDCLACQAVAQVLSRPPGIARVAEEDEYGRLRVYDLSDKWLNIPDVDLVDPVTGRGARGYAVRLEWEDQECAIDPYLPVKWEIMSLLPLDTGCPS